MVIEKRIYVVNGKITKIVTVVNFNSFAVIRVCYHCGRTRMAIIDFNKN